MFLPVACLKCGKLFQVPEAAAGSQVDCPWCKAQTPALPVAGMAQPRAESLPVPGTSEPLSLDDAPPSEPRPQSRPPRRKHLLFHLGLGLILCLAIAAATVAVLRYGSGNISPVAWSDFMPPDGSCSIALPGKPDAERIEPTPADGIARGLEQYTTTGWYSRTRVWFGWRELDPAWVKVALQDHGGAMTSPVLTAERDKRRIQTGGTVTMEVMIRFGPHTGLEVQMDTARGKLVERYILALEGPRPRLYFMGLEAKNATPDSAAAQRLFNSFRVNPTAKQ
jgi:hypothetical protein